MTGSPSNQANLEAESSISPHCAIRSAAGWLACAPVEVQEGFLGSLTAQELAGLPWLFEFWAMEHQLSPESDWRSWVILGGRGAGKTRAGAEWVRSMAEGARPGDAGRASRIALVGETLDQAREVMVFGQSGIMACSPPDRRPDWIATRRLLRWPNGAEAQLFSAHDPDALRGPQFDAAWVDELAKWKQGEAVWDNLQLCLRLGDDPRVCVTTTPRASAALKALLAAPSTVSTHATTFANKANLAAGFLEEVQRRFAGSRKGRQELEGMMLADVEGALWPAGLIEAALVREVPELDRIVVAVDPGVSADGAADECGIVVVGAQMQGPPQEWRAYVLEDASMRGSPLQWARAAIAARERHGAERVVAEVNQGGALVEQLLRQIDPLVPYRAVRASAGKAARAEPVAALYEQGRVRHVPGLSVLEEQMGQMTSSGYQGKGSPDRVDALVWALTEALIEPSNKWRQPRLRALG